MGIFTYVLRDYNIFLNIAISAVVYGLLVVLLRVVSHEEFRFLEGLIVHKPGKADGWGYLKALLPRRVPEPIRKWAQLIADRLPPSVRYGKPYKDALALLKESKILGTKRPLLLIRISVCKSWSTIAMPIYRIQRGLSAKRPYSQGHSDRK